MCHFITHFLPDALPQGVADFVTTQVKTTDFGKTEQLKDLLVVLVVDAVILQIDTSNAGKIDDTGDKFLKSGLRESKMLIAAQVDFLNHSVLIKLIYFESFLAFATLLFIIILGSTGEPEFLNCLEEGGRFL